MQIIHTTSHPVFEDFTIDLSAGVNKIDIVLNEAREDNFARLKNKSVSYENGEAGL